MPSRCCSALSAPHTLIGLGAAALIWRRPCSAGPAADGPLPGSSRDVPPPSSRGRPGPVRRQPAAATSSCTSPVTWANTDIWRLTALPEELIHPARGRRSGRGAGAFAPGLDAARAADPSAGRALAIRGTPSSARAPGGRQPWVPAQAAGRRGAHGQAAGLRPGPADALARDRVLQRPDAGHRILSGSGYPPATIRF